MKRRSNLCFLFTTFSVLLSGCRKEDKGPGMVVSFSAMLQGRSISIKSVRLPDGSPGFNPGSFGGNRKDWREGKVAGMAGDRRDLPEWVEFEWSEPPYPEDPNQSLEEYRALPRKTQHVQIRSRVPQDVVDEAIEANTHIPPGELLPVKWLWVYFIWTEQGVRFRWRLADTRPQGKSREGGDDPSEF